MNARPWLRPALVGVFVLTLPLTWVEHVPAGCSGVPGTEPARETGIGMLRDKPELAVWIGLILSAALVLGYLAMRLRPLLEIAAEFAATLALASSAAIAHFAATFHVFEVTRLRPASLIGLGALMLGALDALWRAVSKSVDWVSELRKRK